MEINRRFDQPWLELLLKADSVASHCKQHGHRCRYFCIDCMGISFCNQCKEKELQHEGHQTLTTYKGSRSVAVRVADIQELLDSSEVHPFILNDTTVMFLNSRKREGQEFWSNGCYSCVMCHWRLSKPKLFCSIGCSVQMWMKTEAKEKQAQEAKEKKAQASHRKGTPIRSPLY